MRLSAFDDWARGHHGLITLAASVCPVRPGIERSTRARSNRSTQFVARLPDTPRTPEQRIAAAVLAIGDGALASHRSAARLWGAARPDTDPVDLIAPNGRRDDDLDGVVIHATGDLKRLRPQRRCRIACTNISRTLVDLGAVDAEGVGDAVGHALATKLVDLRALETTLADHAGKGRRGVVALRNAIDGWSIDAKPADSTLEAAMARLVRRYHLPPVTFHPVIEGWEVDFHVLGSPVILECDGWAFHGLDRTTFERDRIRDAQLTAAGWIVVRFTYRSIASTPARTARRIRDAVARWSDFPAPDAA
jgi:very-short-patch-repair endonuclease